MHAAHGTHARLTLGRYRRRTQATAQLQPNAFARPGAPHRLDTRLTFARAGAKAAISCNQGRLAAAPSGAAVPGRFVHARDTTGMTCGESSTGRVGRAAAACGCLGPLQPGNPGEMCRVRLVGRS